MALGFQSVPNSLLRCPPLREQRCEKLRDRKTDRQPDRQTDNQTDRQTETEVWDAERHTDRQEYRQTETEVWDAERHTDRQTGIQTDRNRSMRCWETYRQTDRQEYRQADSQTGLVGAITRTKWSFGFWPFPVRSHSLHVVGVSKIGSCEQMSNEWNACVWITTQWSERRMERRRKSGEECRDTLLCRKVRTEPEHIKIHEMKPRGSD